MRPPRNPLRQSDFLRCCQVIFYQMGGKNIAHLINNYLTEYESGMIYRNNKAV